MGVTGLSVAWRLAHARYRFPEWIAFAIAAVAVVAFVLMVVAYAIKLVSAFAAVRDEYRHPVCSNLFGTVLISLLQLPIVIGPFARGCALIIWTVGAAGMILFVCLIANRWVAERLIAHATPASIIPIAGLLCVPLALPGLGLPHVHELMVAALAIGLFFAVLVFALILTRLAFDAPLPAALKPSLLILVAPFAVGYSTYTVTVQRTDLFAEALFMLTLFLLAVLLGQLRHLPTCCPFRVSWWSVSFPLAASSVAALRFADARPGVFNDTVALLLLGLTTGIVAWLLVGTLVDLARGRLPDRQVEN